MSHSQRTNPLLLIGLPVVVVLVLASAYFQITVRQPSKKSAEMNQTFALRVTGLANPLTNQLDPRYTDANGDMLADAPSTNLLNPDTLRFSYIATDEPERYQTVFAPVLAELAKATGKKVEYVLFTSAEEQLRALRDGQLHIAGLNTGSVPLAVNQAGFVPVATLATDTGNAFYETQIITPPASVIQSPADLKARPLVLTDPSSNSGFKAPLVRFKDAHAMLPERDYFVRYSGGQDQSIDFIATGKLDDSADFAAAVASDLLARAVTRGTLTKDKYRVIETIGKFPPATFGHVHNLDPALASKINSALATLKFTGTTAEEFAASGQLGLAPLNYKTDFDLVRKVDDRTGNDHTKALLIPEPAPHSGPDAPPEAAPQPTAEPTAEPAPAPAP